MNELLLYESDDSLSVSSEFFVKDKCTYYRPSRHRISIETEIIESSLKEEKKSEEDWGFVSEDEHRAYRCRITTVVKEETTKETINEFSTPSKVTKNIKPEPSLRTKKLRAKRNRKSNFWSNRKSKLSKKFKAEKKKNTSVAKKEFKDSKKNNSTPNSTSICERPRWSCEERAVIENIIKARHKSNNEIVETINEPWCRNDSDVLDIILKNVKKRQSVTRQVEDELINIRMRTFKNASNKKFSVRSRAAIGSFLRRYYISNGKLIIIKTEKNEINDTYNLYFHEQDDSKEEEDINSSPLFPPTPTVKDLLERMDFGLRLDKEKIKCLPAEDQLIFIADTIRYLGTTVSSDKDYLRSKVINYFTLSHYLNYSKLPNPPLNYNVNFIRRDGEIDLPYD